MKKIGEPLVMITVIEINKITSIVIGPGENLIVESATQNNVFSLVGFEDASTAFTTRVFGATA